MERNKLQEELETFIETFEFKMNDMEETKQYYTNLV